MQSRADCVYMAKCAELAEDYNTMICMMRKVVGFGEELNTDERNLLAVAYKNYVASAKTSLRLLGLVEGK